MLSFFKRKPTNPGTILVLGGTGKTGRRVAKHLTARGLPVRIGSRTSDTPFDWNDPSGWPAVLESVTTAYINYAPDLAVPGAKESIEMFVGVARESGVKRLVLLSGRGEAEAQACERIVQTSGLEWTIVRASWFNQNFTEGAFTEMVQAGAITLPVGQVAEPFIDVHDIADVAVAALTEAGHNGEVYEVTGPRLMTFSEVAAELSTATGRPIRLIGIPHAAFVVGLKQAGTPEDVAWLLDYLFSEVLDGRNAAICDGVERALGRKPRDFADFAREAAASGVWEKAA